MEPFDLMDSGWHDRLNGADLVVSSLVVHHLDDVGKAALFKTVYDRISDRAALLIADLVRPQRPEADRLFAGTWDRSTWLQSEALFGSDEPFRLFQDEHWNIYWYPDPEVDRPSALFDQLRWMRDAGFAVVDCFWMRAAHAIYGGYKDHAGESGELELEDALRLANAALGRE